MAQRLDWIKRQPQQWVSWSPLLGGLKAHQLVAQRYAEAIALIEGPQQHEARHQIDRAWIKSMWHRWWHALSESKSGRAYAQPSADLLWANLSLHVSDEPQRLLRAWLDRLTTGGMLMFSCLGPDTLREIRQVHQSQGWPAPAHPMTDMHDWGDMLIETGFAEPIMDMERLTLTYSSAQAMLVDLRAWGRNLHSERFASLRGRAYRTAWLAAMESSLPRTPEGQLRLTVEVIYGHAIKPVPRLKVAESTAISLHEMKQLLRDRASSTRHPPTSSDTNLRLGTVFQVRQHGGNILKPRLQLI